MVMSINKLYLFKDSRYPNLSIENYGDRDFYLYIGKMHTILNVDLNNNSYWEINDKNIELGGDFLLEDQIKTLEKKEKKTINNKDFENNKKRAFLLNLFGLKNDK